MKFEDVLPALRAGGKVRLTTPNELHGDGYIFSNGYHYRSSDCGIVNLSREYIDSHDWEIVPEPKRVADYLAPCPNMPTVWFQNTYEIGKQPVDAVLIPGTEREVPND